MVKFERIITELFDKYTYGKIKALNRASEMQEGGQIQLIYLKDNEAKYRIRREQLIDGQSETITYYIYFVKDENGLWKIDRF
ncbi:MAG: hypothetical protein ACOYT4_00730 [Nanoarchaeota archaeon]